MAIQSFTIGQTLTAAQMTALQANDYNQTITAKTTSATLVVGDVGTHVQMTAATATTISVPAATFAAGDSLFISSQGAGAVTIQPASTAITLNGSGTALSQFGGGTLRFQSSSACTFFKAGGAGANSYGIATGGASSTAITVGGISYTLLTFTADSNLVVSTAGLFDVLMFSGGGAGAGVGAGSDGIGVGCGAAVNYVLV